MLIRQRVGLCYSILIVQPWQLDLKSCRALLLTTHLWLGSQVGKQTSIIVISYKCIGSLVPPIILLFQSNGFFYLERIHNVMYIQKCKHCNTTENNSTLYQIILFIQWSIYSAEEISLWGCWGAGHWDSSRCQEH